ncbi:MAG: 16S rRNA (cytidine(1402)-2'-O)-methyltransferase [Bacillota bacterium]|nr:16S rRNA (cytidine(1402)-2'-O)-methyltransferase [Bacillota bacterium]MDW7684709.1 16S rRNA (cytidine(1402)-2'-O)-methyltransferase [Bacillota bacterium]
MTLFLCPTPIGNLEDVTLRVLQVLREADKIAAEDTRHTRKLLSHYDIHTPLVSYHEHNKHKKTAVILDWLREGINVALVSDAGTPGIADPGEELVREAIGLDIPVVALPGPVAAVTALTASGLPTTPFTFYGFLPVKGKGRKEAINGILGEEKTVVFYEAPHRLVKTLQELAAAAPKRQLAVARELTKHFEEFVRGPAEDVLAHFEKTQPRGECTLVLAANEKKPAELPDPLLLVNRLVGEGMEKKEALRLASEQSGVPRNEIYRMLLEKK